MAGETLLSRRRLAALHEFLLSQLPPPPARVLEVGCGDGELAQAVARSGYDVTAIDPKAPPGALFQRVSLEDFGAEARFDAVVASVSLHHVEALGSAFDKIERLLHAGGVLILEEFAKERFTGATARWYYHQRQALAAVGLGDARLPGDVEAWLGRWREEHADIHASEALRAEIDARFTERYCAWGPYLYDYRLHDALEPLERELIASGAIEATGLRYIGVRL